jgi:CheY-like chemotaxis protein
VLQKGVILLAEDSDDDAVLFRLAARKAGLSELFVHVRDGEEAINYLTGLRSRHESARESLPRILITDLKMPKITGFELVQWVRKQPDLQSLKIIVLSGSVVERDKASALNLGADAYWAKPPDLEDLIRLMREVKEHWLGNSAG